MPKSPIFCELPSPADSAAQLSAILGKATRRRLVHEKVLKLKCNDGTRREQYLVTETSVASIRQFMETPVPETFSCLVKQRLLARVVDCHSPQRRVRDMPYKLIRSIENGQFRFYRKRNYGTPRT